MTHCHPEKFWFVLPGAGYYFFKVPQSFQQGATFENHCPRQNHMHSSWTGPRRGVSLLQLQPVSGQQGDCGGHTPANPPSPRCSSYVRSIPFSGRLDGWKLFAQAQALRLGMSFMYQLIGASAVLACQHLPIRASLKAFPFFFFLFFLLWSFSSPQSAFEPLLVYSHLLGVYLFPYSILKMSDGVSTKMHSCDNSTREAKMSKFCFSFPSRSYMTPMHQPRASSRASLGTSLMPSALPPCGQSPTRHRLPHVYSILKKFKASLLLRYFSDLSQILLPTMQLLSF